MEVKEVISNVYSDALTGIEVVEDVRGDFHIIQSFSSPVQPSREKVYLQSIVKTNWPGTIDFYQVPNYFVSGQYLDYIVPAGKIFSIAFVLASQTGSALSTIGIFKDGTINIIAPLRDNLFYSYNDPSSFVEGTNLSVRFFPAGKGVELSIVVGGYLINA